MAAHNGRMRLVLAAVEPPLADAWERFCGDLEFVSIHEGDILEVACEAVVSPANSFGFMDGGIDAQYLDFFGPKIQLQDRYLVPPQLRQLTVWRRPAGAVQGRRHVRIDPSYLVAPRRMLTRRRGPDRCFR